jgi:ABC-type branched-subunit amino acid transport system ATPase component
MSAAEVVTAEFILDIRGLTKRFGGVTAVHNCSFQVPRNIIAGLIGPNGSGKTTLFNLLTGLLRCDGGNYLFKGEPMIGLTPHEIFARGISRTFQVIRVFREMTVLENLVAVSRNGSLAGVRQRALELLDFVTLLRLKDEYAGNLSYGQQKLLEFVRALMSDPEVLLLDEPAAGVNRTLLNALLDRIHQLRDQGKTILIVEHDMKVIMNHCERVFVLDYGEKIAEGLPEEIQRNERVIEAYFGHT